MKSEDPPPPYPKQEPLPAAQQPMLYPQLQPAVVAQPQPGQVQGEFADELHRFIFEPKYLN